MNLLGYVKKFGHLDFKQKPFNNVDATICITLAYLNFELYLKENEEIIIKDILDEQIVPLCAGEFTTRQNRKLIKLLRVANRYQNGIIRYVRSVLDKKTTTQFFAMTLFLPDLQPIICFRGTDLTVVGWKEDLMMVLNDAVLSHIEARDYVNDINRKINQPFFLGGHSKGGNLALYSAINCEATAQEHILRIYNLDGPGFRNTKIFDRPEFFKIRSRLVQIFPKDDVVGALFNNPEGRYIIKSKRFGVFQHNPYNWIVSRAGSFSYINKIPIRIKIRNRAFYAWLLTLTREDCILLIDVFITYFGGIDANLVDFFKRFFSSLKRTFKLYTTYPKATRKRIRKIMHNLWRAHLYSRRYYRSRKKNDNNQDKK